MPRTVSADSSGAAGRKSSSAVARRECVCLCACLCGLCKVGTDALNWREKSGKARASVTQLFLWLQVDLSFSPSEGLPSSDAHLLFRASPNSLCAVRAVDKSVLLMKPEADLSPSSVSAESVQQVRASAAQCWRGNSEQPLLSVLAQEGCPVLFLIFVRWAKRGELGSSCFLGGLCDCRDGTREALLRGLLLLASAKHCCLMIIFQLLSPAMD